MRSEAVPLIRHDVTGWEPIADQAAIIRHTGCEGPAAGAQAGAGSGTPRLGAVRIAEQGCPPLIGQPIPTR